MTQRTDQSQSPQNNTSASGHDLTPPSAEQLAVLAAGLTDEERRILLRHGTESPFCGGPSTTKRTERTCAGSAPFHCSDRAKFESGTGWPSFYTSYDPDHIRYLIDGSHGMSRTETRCRRWGR